MNIQVALQNTVTRCNGLIVQSVTQQGTLWTIRLGKQDMELTFEIDETVGCACVLEYKNGGFKSLSRFMKTFQEEISELEENEIENVDEDMEEDPVGPQD